MMQTIIQDVSEEITNELRNLKTDKDKDQVIFINLLKMLHCLRYDVYNSNTDVDFSNKVEDNNIIEETIKTICNDYWKC